ncbi:hypothetical protein E3Q08_02282 [Wallemia mellicola]|uniref:PX domain-containing protein n=1 Tax=Wallemia mellicola TaxID=1708541 RepID=A0A4T0RZ38_9BASI|nr:hypothetical protein E3Q08_02282 [Wallemia mellicola]TIC67475.1 hypothetical protein E3Q01_01242 [Wallemia mellicola]
MEDPLSQSTPDLYQDNENAWGDVPTSQSMYTQTSSIDKPLPSPIEERDKQRSRNSSLLSVSSAANNPGKIYGQPDNPLPQPSVVNASASNSTITTEFIRFRVTAIQKNRRDYLVEFDVSTNIKQFESTIFRNVQRTYEELLKLSEQLALANPQTIVPALPPNQTNAQTEEEDDRRVKLSLQNWFDRISYDEDLRKDMDLKAFVMNKFSYVPVQVFKRKASTSSFNWLGRPTPDDDLELVTAKDIHSAQEVAFLACVNALENVIRRNRDLSNCESDVGEKLVNLSIVEKNRTLSNGLESMGRAEHAISDIGLTKCANDLITVYDGFNYHASNARAVKDTLQQRTQLLEEYQLAVKASISKRRTLEKMKGSSSLKPEKVDEMLADLQIANGYEKHLAGKVEGMSRNLHMSLEKHSVSTKNDIHQLLMENARMNVLCSSQSITELESVASVIENIGVVDSTPVVKTVSRQEQDHMAKEKEQIKKERVDQKENLSKAEKVKQPEIVKSSKSSLSKKSKNETMKPYTNEIDSSKIATSTTADPLGVSKVVKETVPEISQSTIIPTRAKEIQIPNPMTQSTTSLPSMDKETREKNERKRKNAREAAYKLANAF